MKKTLFIMAAAALTLASCSENEPVEENHGSAIGFRPAMGTRATETTNANLSSFQITALLGETSYFTDQQFVKGSDNYFISTPLYYWPGDSTVSFYAYSPTQDELGADIVIEGSSKKMENYVTPEEIADQVDFITANATGKKSTNEKSGVELTFNHRLSQIELQAKNENPNYIVKVKGMRIGRAETTGSFDFDTNTWTLDDWHDTYVYTSSCDEVTLSTDPVSIMGPSGNAMLIPQTLTPWSPVNDPDNVAREAYLSVLVNITTPQGIQLYPFSGNTNEYAWVAVPMPGNNTETVNGKSYSNTVWEQGKKYIYILDFTDGAGNTDPDEPIPGKPVLNPIKATVLVNDWVDSNQGEIVMPGIEK